MKTSWLIGMMLIWVIFQMLASIAEGNSTPLATTGGNVNTTTLNSLMTPEFEDSNVATSLWTVGKNMAQYFTTFLNLLSWNYPTLFSGSWVYVRYLLVCFSCGIAFSIFVIARGVPNY